MLLSCMAVAAAAVTTFATKAVPPTVPATVAAAASALRPDGRRATVEPARDGAVDDAQAALGSPDSALPSDDAIDAHDVDAHDVDARDGDDAKVDDADDVPPLRLEMPTVRALTAADLPPASVFAYGRRDRLRGLPGRAWSADMVARLLAAGDRTGFRAIAEREARAFGIPPEFADAVMAIESSYNPATIGADGEIGLMQLMPATARMLGFAGTLEELAVPETNIHYGVRYLAGAWRLGRQDICTAAMKYRAGHGETRFSYRSVDYCLKVRAHLAARGVVVTGAVPEPTFGEPVGAGAVRRPSLAARTDLDALNAGLRQIGAAPARDTAR
ncbi:lytic transglycosylase domain-containing protein [Rhodoplanes azumiensis]|uniref:Lytic transglycosylase domain-containing protein n=1 Tax=Rhodoplanes azumiensis TaxID=1897628 RepID=A0ABW5AL49_9BRAD